jgi:G3E family GTPase
MELLIVTGPLGAGKTTVVNRLLRDSLREGHRVALVVNEFGETSVDGTILLPFRPELEGIANLVNGCVCCSLRKDVVETLARWASRPTGDRPSRVVLETTGLADPVDLVDLEREEVLQGRLRLAGILTVLSCLTPTETLLVDPVLHHQILLASHLFLSKGDLDKEAERRWLEALRRDYPSVAVHTAVLGRPDSETTDPWRGDLKATPAEGRRGTSSFGSARSTTLRWDHPVDPEGLDRLLRNPLPGGTLLRAKGICRFEGWPARDDGSDRWIFQFADWRVDLAPFPLLEGEPAPTECVVIGRDLDLASWRRALRELERPPKGARRRMILSHPWPTRIDSKGGSA